MIFNYNNKEYELIFLTKTGSRMYGNFTETSDWDYRGIFIESINNKVSLIDKPLEKIGEANKDGEELYKILKNLNLDIEETIDIEIYELSRFLDLALDNNPNIMDLLCCNIDNATYLNDYGRLVLNNKELFLSKKLKDSFSGYALSQLRKMNSHKKWINEFPSTHIILNEIEVLYKEKQIDFDWISDNFGGKVALKTTTEDSQNKKNFTNVISWDEFEKILILKDIKVNPNKYRVPQLINYCYPKKIQGESIKLDTNLKDLIDYDKDISLKTFLEKEASFRNLSPTTLSVFTKGKGIFTRNGNLNSNPPKDIGDFVCFLSIDQTKFKSDRDYINQMWEWKCKRNEVRGSMEDLYGYDIKNASHLIRLLDACEEILNTNNYIPELSGERLQRVKDIRSGKYTYDEVIDYAVKKDEKLDLLLKSSQLKDNPNLEKIEEILKFIYLEQFEKNKLDIRNLNI